MTTLPFEVLEDPYRHGYVVCEHCNGYGSSLQEESLVCSKCDGASLVKFKHDRSARCGKPFGDAGVKDDFDGAPVWICTLKPGHAGVHAAPDVKRRESK